MIRTTPALPLDDLRSPKRSKSEIKRSTNSSGVSGVHFKSPNVGHPGYWLAITYTSGKGSVSKAFSIKEHGAEQAKQMAIAERERQLEQKLLYISGTGNALAIAFRKDPERHVQGAGAAAAAPQARPAH